MTSWANDSGVWKENVPYVNDGGIWKEPETAYVNDGGVWKPFYEYESAISASYWRLNVSDHNGSVTQNDLVIRELEFRSAVGVSDVPTGGTASSDSEGAASGPAYQAFDGDTNTYATLADKAVMILQYQFSSPKQVREVYIRAGSSNYPIDFTIDYSDDGSNWVTAISVTNETDWTVPNKSYLVE